MSGWEGTVTAYGLVLVGALVATLVARRRPDVLGGLGVVVTWAMRRRSTQLFLLLTWWWLGWHLVTSR